MSFSRELTKQKDCTRQTPPSSITTDFRPACIQSKICHLGLRNTWAGCWVNVPFKLDVEAFCWVALHGAITHDAVNKPTNRVYQMLACRRTSSVNHDTQGIENGTP